MNNLVIKKPIISEKSFALASDGVYVFLVSSNANKKVVAGQIRELYKVDVEQVRMINIPGKVKKTGRKVGVRSDIKKALVKVKKGQKIAIFEESTTQKENTDKAQMKSEDKKSDNKKEITSQIDNTEATQKETKK